MAHIFSLRKRIKNHTPIWNLKSQSAMEYLMTYGWAILIIAIVLVALFSLGVFNSANFAPKATAGACRIYRGYAQYPQLAGQCNNEIPQFVAEISSSSADIAAGSINIPALSSSSGAVTVTEWVYVSSYSGSPGFFSINSAGNGMSFSAFIDENGCSASTNYFLPIITLSGDTLYNDACVPPSQFPLNTWVFLVSEINPSEIAGYLGTGGSITTSTGGGSLSTTLTPTSFDMGYSGFDRSYLPKGSMISNVQIYNTSLSASDIQSLYLEGIGGAPIDPTSIVGWWPLNGDTTDYSGENNNGQATGISYNGNWWNGYTQP